MSDLQRKLVGKGLPRGLPPRPLMGRVGGVGRGGKGPLRKSYNPLSWKCYWKGKEWIQTDQGSFCVYEMGNKDADTVVCMLHGGGYSALTWSVMASELTKLTNCKVVAFDLRGHGETSLAAGENEELDLSGMRMAHDVREVIHSMFENESVNIVLVGHSMGGAIATIAAEGGFPGLAGLIVIDVVEGTALEALASMHNVLQGRPKLFRSIEQAVEWCVRSGQVRNHESARVSMPGQIVNNHGVLAAKLVENDDSEKDASTGTSMKRQPSVSRDSIREESEENDEDTFKTPVTPTQDGLIDRTPPETFTGKDQFKWRIDLAKTESHWAGWFTGLSNRFLGVPAAKMLLLAGVDRLDKDLTVGQMQGKFQMQVLPQVGHTVHEDSPDRVAEVIATFLIRNKFCTATDCFTPSFPAC